MSLDGASGFFLSLLTESFVVRAVCGCVVAATLAAIAVRAGCGQAPAARRLLVLAPVLIIAVAGIRVLVAQEAYLPQLWVTTAPGSAAGQLLDLLGQWRGKRDLELLVVAYAAVVAVLLARRAAGAWRVWRLLGAGERLLEPALVQAVERLSARFGMPAPRLVVLANCPGGAFTAGTRQPVVAVDPLLLKELDRAELEGLLAHELAHAARRDPLVGLLVGIVRDVAFFVPSVHRVVRWLRAEQEQGADELASRHTGKPVALASSILKVWDSTRLAGGPRVAACGAVPSGAVALPRYDPAQLVAARVERLLEAPSFPTRLRRAGEGLLAVAVLFVGAYAALVLPDTLARDYDAYSLSLGYLAAPPQAAVESPAFATFRALTPQAPSRADAAPQAVSPVPPPESACPCVESQAQLHQGIGATVPDVTTRMVWRTDDEDPWQVPDAEAIRAARPLWTLSDSGPQVGFFVVGRAPAPS